ITPQEVAQAQLELEIGDLVREKGVKGARDYLQETGMLQKEPIVERFFNAVVGKTPGVMEQMLTTGTEARISTLAGDIVGFVSVGKIMKPLGIARGVARVAGPLAGRVASVGATFAARGTQEVAARLVNDEEVTPEEAAKHIVNLTLFGAGFGVAGGAGAAIKPVLEVPAEGLYGFLAAKLSGASYEEALLTGALFIGFGIFNARAIPPQLKQARLGRLMKDVDKKLSSRGEHPAIVRMVKEELYKRWSGEKRPDFKRMVKSQEEMWDIYQAKKKESFDIRKTGEPIGQRPGEVVAKSDQVGAAITKPRQEAGQVRAVAKKPAEVSVQAPKEGIKPEIRPEVPVKVPPREVKAVPEVPGAAEAAKEPWEMTQEEYVSLINPSNYRIPPEGRPVIYSADIEGMYPPDAPIISKGRDKAGVEVVIRKHNNSYFAEVKGKPAGYALELGEGVDVTVAEEFQGHGIGTELDYLLRKDFPTRESGGLTETGEKTVRRVHKRFVEESLSEGKPVPAAVLAEYPELAVPEKGAALLKVQEAKKPKPKREQGKLGLGVQAKIPRGGIRAPKGAPAPEEGAPLWEAGKEEAAREAEKRQVKIGEPAEPLFMTGGGRFVGQTILDPRRADEMPAIYAASGVSAEKDYPGFLEGVKWGHRGLSPVGATDVVVRDKTMPQDYDLLTIEELPPSFITKYGPESVRDKVTGGLDFDKLAELAKNELRDVVFAQGEYAGEPQYQESWAPDNLEEATKFYSVAGPIDPELVRAGIREAQSFGIATKKVLERFVRRGTTHMRKLGAGGVELARDIDEITFNVQREANNDALDIREIMKGLTPKERTRVAMVTDNEIPIHTQTKRVVERSNRLRKVLDRQLEAFTEVGGRRRLGGPGDEQIPAGGGGRAFPQVPNKEGRAVLKELSTGAMTPRVVQAAEWLVEKGKAKNYDEAIQQLSLIRNSQLRSVNPYFERTRTPLPTYLREWDPYKVLSGSMERNWMTIEGIRKWGWDEKGESFPGANELIGKIAQEKPTDAELVHQFIRSSFGFGSKASESAQRISRDLRAVQFVGKIAVSPLTITRNMIDRFAKGYTTGGLSITLRATLKFPPIVNVFIKSSRQIKEQMIRSGAVFSHGSIAEGVEPGGIIMKMIGKPFTASERGNQIYEAVVAKLKLERDIQLYLEAKPESRLGKIFKAIQGLGENTEKQITDRIKEAGLAEKSTEEMVDLLAKSKGADLLPIEIQAVLHRAVRDQAFPVILSTKRLWWEDSPFAKVLTQFKVWPIEQVGFIYRSAMKQAHKGNVLPLVRFIVGVIIAGELYNIARDAVYDKEEALLTNLRRRPDKRNAKDIAWILYKDALDGGLVGMFADLAWGIWDWALGPTAGTIGELGKTILSAIRRPGLTVSAIKKAMRRDVSAVRQAEGVLNKIGVLVGKDGKRAVQYNRW
ncbi:MAG: hypothetical protein J3T61_06515, partial [Candidatus Brocadiales bacterium]|nr:hypothetical protein [Candidatus Bathyanammoxibius sp.]